MRPKIYLQGRLIRARALGGCASICCLFAAPVAFVISIVQYGFGGPPFLRHSGWRQASPTKKDAGAIGYSFYFRFGRSECPLFLGVAAGRVRIPGARHRLVLGSPSRLATLPLTGLDTVLIQITNDQYKPSWLPCDTSRLSVLLGGRDYLGFMTLTTVR